MMHLSTWYRLLLELSTYRRSLVIYLIQLVTLYPLSNAHCIDETDLNIGLFVF